jgi:sugar/nucleoside kinase (ribokinase family)
MRTTYDVVVMGDINLDWCSRGLLSFPFAELAVSEGVVREGFEWAPIDEMPGGSGLNFARFAQEMGYAAILLGKIGDDPTGRFIYEWLQQRRLEAGVSVSTSLSTGKAFIARDKNDIRLLVNNAPNANRALSVSDVEQHADVITSCRILYVSGYCLMDPQAPRAKATLKAMKLAHKGGQAHIVFDVVPHRFYKIYQSSKFRDLLAEIDILISGVPTIRRLLNMGVPSEKITRPVVRETVKRLSESCDRFCLRFGSSGCDEQVIWDAQGQNLTWEETRHNQTLDKRGYGDRLTVRLLKDFFNILPTNKTTSAD